MLAAIAVCAVAVLLSEEQLAQGMYLSDGCERGSGAGPMPGGHLSAGANAAAGLVLYLMGIFLLK